MKAKLVPILPLLALAQLSAVDAADDMLPPVRAHLYVEAVFRNVDQSDPEIQQQIMNFIEDIVATTASIVLMPAYFWLWDAQKFLSDNPGALSSLTFREQLALFLEDPVYRDLYGDDILRNEEGDIIESRTFLVTDFSLEGDDAMSPETIDALQEEVLSVTQAQPVNQGRNQDELAFFTNLHLSLAMSRDVYEQCSTFPLETIGNCSNSTLQPPPQHHAVCVMNNDNFNSNNKSYTATTSNEEYTCDQAQKDLSTITDICGASSSVVDCGSITTGSLQEFFDCAAACEMGSSAAVAGMTSLLVSLFVTLLATCSHTVFSRKI